MNMADKVELQMLRKLIEERHQTTLTHMYMIDDMMDEILMFDSAESMREIALYVKSIIKNMEEVA